MELMPESSLTQRPPSPKKRKRVRQACDRCRAKKIRCNGEQADRACPNCLDRGTHCVTSSSRVQPHVAGCLTPRPAQIHGSDQRRASGASRPIGLLSPNTASVGVSVHTEDSDIFPEDAVNAQSLLDGLGEESSILPNDMTNWEYHGPRSYLSICSKPAVEWVSEHTKTTGFAGSASAFVTDITRRLKMDVDVSVSRMPDPDADTAWRYTKAYFDASLDASLGILHRPWFEQQLTAHFAGLLCDPGPTWHALRNIVFAAGCRIEQSKSTSFQEASRRAWGYFENALSVYTRLLFFKTSITGVQVLTLMAYYTQNIGTPCLEYMLSADAARLAYAKGLHRAAPSSQGLSAQDTEQRSCIFWALYCLEKQVASQASRPSAIDDAEITCPLPSGGLVGSTMSVPYCHSLIRISQVSSKIEKELSPIRGMKHGPAATIDTIGRLDSELVGVKASLNYAFGLFLGERFTTLPPLGGLTMEQYLYVQYAYTTAMLSIHTILAYPWMRALIGIRSHDQFRDAIGHSIAATTKSSRDAVMLTEHIHFGAQTSVPVAFFGPIYSLISLFVCCIDCQTSPSDLAIMDVGAGYFGRIHIATDSLVSVPFVRVLTSLASANSTQAAAAHSAQPARVPEQVNTGLQATSGPEEDFWGLDLLDNTFDLEDWSTFSRTSPNEPTAYIESLP